MRGVCEGPEAAEVSSSKGVGGEPEATEDAPTRPMERPEVDDDDDDEEEDGADDAPPEAEVDEETDPFFEEFPTLPATVAALDTLTFPLSFSWGAVFGVKDEEEMLFPPSPPRSSPGSSPPVSAEEPERGSPG